MNGIIFVEKNQRVASFNSKTMGYGEPYIAANLNLLLPPKVHYDTRKNFKILTFWNTDNENLKLFAQCVLSVHLVRPESSAVFSPLLRGRPKVAVRDSSSHFQI